MLLKALVMTLSIVATVSDLVNQGTDTARETRKPIRLDCL
jgi:hypothetical protein